MAKGHPKPCSETLDLLAGWTPPDPAIRYDEGEIRGADLSMRIAQALKLSLKESGVSREDVAKAMSEYLGEDVPKSALDAYASPAKEHEISHKRLIALAVVLKDRRLLSIAAEEMDCIVVPASYGDLIQIAVTAEKLRELEQVLATKRSLLNDMGLFG